MKILFLVLFLFQCRAHLLNRTIGYKEFPMNREGKPIVYLDEPTIYSPMVTIEDSPEIQPKYKLILKEAIRVSILNSGRFSEVKWKDSMLENPEDIYLIEILFSVSELARVGSYPYNQNFFFFYIPYSENEKKNEKIFWPTFIPGFWPASGYFPLLAKSGTIRTNIDCKIKLGKKDPIHLSVDKTEDYNLLFYGVYRTREVEDKAVLSIEKALDDLSLQLADLELESNKTDVEPIKKSKKSKPRR
ncbi:MAG TPA: hypothetical protein PK079_22315 [Leptospiraceae bacterium]|nr:hypothetical protein [Leptospiraceae bacterium]HMW04312.1 hypothetical protein [Leptospiraceae bacterium]HMX30658.1 hypothetical protein [Leptospiraceae bacterium]HMY31358.1 hypothetical protein [Leptospiraceae bacterium]HMZ63605.1 hypothetical protein [Leptospiraceae bacterium]